jgi:hypothetical protein
MDKELPGFARLNIQPYFFAACHKRIFIGYLLEVSLWLSM